MQPLRRFLAFLLVCAATWLLPATRAAEPRAQRLTLTAPGELSRWDADVPRLLAAGALRMRRSTPDTLISGRVHERYQQLYSGVPVFGGELVRQSDGERSLSIFGTLYRDIQLDTTPQVSAAAARSIVERLAGREQGDRHAPQLMVLPRDDGGYALVWRVSAFTDSDLRVYFVDARSGEIDLEYSNLQRQGVAAIGTGVLNDQKKMSVLSGDGTFRASDELRPPQIATFDVKGDLFKALRYLSGSSALLPSDLAQDSDNTWTDGAVVDAHTYAGWTYDYYYQRFGRRGLDNADIPITSVVHPVRRADVFTYSSDIVGAFYLNAFYAGDGIMVYGEGLEPPLKAGGLSWNYLAGGLDVVAHELTHGVTEFSSNLVYLNESGALNESFSDVMGTSVEFMFQSNSTGPQRADYLLGEDVITPGGLRSMQNPAAYGDPDHYSLRYTGPADNGGVHINSGIPNNVFYLAIEGGVNRVSGLSVQGVGASNREQIEKAFYRAFTLMLPASANFATARAATLQAARDLYGAASAPERALSQAWTAVGVE